MSKPGRHIVACPRPFLPAEQVALALAEAEQLECYVTGFVWPRYLPDRLFAAVLRKLTGRSPGGIARRKVQTLPPQLVRSIPWLDLGRSLAAAFQWSSAADYFWEADDIRFAKMVCRFLRRCETVHGFEHSSLEFFRAARNEGKHTLLHLASVHPSFQERILLEQFRRWPELKESTGYRLYEQRERRDARRLAEFELADLIATYSTFATRTLVEEGVPADRVVTVPLGAPELSPFEPVSQSATRPAREFTVLFAGVVSVRKGGHLLLEAWSRAQLGSCRLVLAGHNSLPAGFVQRPGVEVLGPVSQSRLFELMQSADVLALPTLIDSFGMVVTEALAHGLPVITTTNAGAADLIDEDVNGWILPAGDIEALTARLVWCADHRERLQEMRDATRQSTRQHTWLEFRQRMRETLSARGFHAEAVAG